MITANGGAIGKHIGDAVMALWGKEAVREDDAERAVRAALEMLEKALGKEALEADLERGRAMELAKVASEMIMVKSEG